MKQLTIASIANLSDMKRFSAIRWLYTIEGTHQFTINPPRLVVGGGPEIERDIFYAFRAGRTCSIPEIYISELENVLIGPSGIIISDSNILYESLFPWEEANFMSQFSGDLWARDGGYTPRIDGNIEDVECVFYAREGGEAGYFHFLNSILPRLAIFSRFRADGTPLLASSYQKFASQMWDIAGISPYVQRSRWLRVKRLIFPSPVIFKGDHFTRSPLANKMLEGWLRAIIPQSEEGSPKRIYISRDDASVRRLTDEAALAERLQRHGVQVVTLSGKSVSEQMRLFSGAELVIGPHGAGLSNVIFAQDKCRVIELVSPARLWPTFRTLCARRGQQYSAVVGSAFDAGQTNARGCGNEDFSVDPWLVERAIEDAMQAPSQ